MDGGSSNESRRASVTAITDSIALKSTVVDKGYCIGCGACAVVPGSGFRIEESAFGCYQAVLRDGGDAGRAQQEDSGRPHSVDVRSVCPFSDRSANESRIAADLFAARCRSDERIGYYRSCHIGHVATAPFRQIGSSGGMATWILTKLLAEGLVDAVIHVHPRSEATDDGRLFAYSISRSAECVLQGAKTRYYPVEMSGVLGEVRRQDLRFAVVGVPCFVKAVRLLQRSDPVLQQRIRFCIGLVCGHLKSSRFAAFFGWQLGVQPRDLVGFDFRHKLPDHPANNYGMLAAHRDRDGAVVEASSGPKSTLNGADWGLGYFKYEACDYCDDVMAETADLVVGDAWLPGYQDDWQGTNVVVVRHPELEAVLQRSVESKEIVLKPASVDAIATSQAANYRHRRDGLAYRLALKDRRRQWRPPKRVPAGSVDRGWRWRLMHRLRVRLARRSHEAFANALEVGDLAVFHRRMDHLADWYRFVVQLERHGYRRLARLPRALWRLVR